MNAFNPIKSIGSVIVIMSLAGIATLSFRQRDVFQARLVREASQTVEARNQERGFGGSGLSGTGGPVCVPPGSESTDPCAPIGLDNSEE